MGFFNKVIGNILGVLFIIAGAVCIVLAGMSPTKMFSSTIDPRVFIALFLILAAICFYVSYVIKKRLKKDKESSK